MTGSIDIEDATVIVVGAQGTWVFANVRADVKTDPVYDGSHGHGATLRPIAHDFTIEGVCDFSTWTAASREAVQQGIDSNPTDQKEG